MAESDGRPLVGATAISLGIRAGYDIEVDEQGFVHQPDFMPKEPNGLSCSPTTESIPPFAIPVVHGGPNKKTTIWRIRRQDLPDTLEAQSDGPTHISIGPADSMPLADYIEAIEQTLELWTRVT